MMRSSVVAGALAAVVFCVSAWVVVAAENVPTKIVTIDKAPDKVDLSRFKSTKSVVPFGHRKHIDMKITCKTCHHKSYENKEAVKCSTCHKAQVEGKVLSVKDAFHEQCKDCHRDKLKASAESKAPTKCLECHR